MRNLNIAASAAFALALAAAPAAAGSLGGPLELQDEGTFFVGGQVITSNFPDAPATGPVPPGQITINQMFVHYRIPKTSTGVQVVLVHGAGHTGVTYETTPDGREGWATYFVRRGHPVYVVDHSGRGRSGFNPTPVNQAKAQSNPALLPNFALSTRERAWGFFLLGPEYPKPWPGQQFPVDALDQYFSQLVPNAETTLVDGGANTTKALAALLDKIGPAVVLVHSQSGAYGLDLVRARSNLMRAFVDVEGNCAPVSAEDVASHFTKVPMLAVWGDYSEGAPGPNGDARRNGCVATTGAVKAAGGNATYMFLPALGIKGNSHMMMMDKNNLQIADLVLKWVDDVAVKR